MANRFPSKPSPYTGIALALMAGLLILRLGLVVWSPLQLYADEAQYWRWSQSLDWGYYSKPPMVAWVIHLSTALFGDSEWAIRLIAPICHAVSGLLLFLLARAMFDSPLSALVTTVAYLLMPGIILSSTILSTDGVLFPFWALALWLTWRLRERSGGWMSAAGLGLALGGGFLSKYAMVYFAIGLALIIVIDRPSRRALLSSKGAFALVLFGALFTPHLYWNAQNGFETVGHTLDNANLGGELFNLENFPTFLADQMGVFGPVSFLILMAGLTFVRGHKDKAMEGDANPFAVRVRWLACFIVPVLVFIGFQAVLSRAHANWAATAYPAASVLVGAVILRLNTGIRTWLTIAGVLALAIQLVPQVSRPALVGVAVCVAGGLLILGALFRWRAIGLFWGGAGLHLAVAAVFAAISIGPASWSAALGLDNALKRTRGWQALADQLVLEAEQRRPSAIILDEREIWHGLDYYTRGRLEAPLILWRYNEGPKNFAEKQALTPALGAAALVASNRSRLRPRIKADFGMWMRVGDIGVDLGNRSNGCPLNRSLILYSVGNYEPQARTPDWVERFKTTDANGRRVDTHLDRPPPCPPLPDKIAE